MIFTELPNDSTTVNAYRDYHPWRGGTNPDFDSYSQLVLDVKFSRPSGLNYFNHVLNEILAHDPFTIVIVPSHNADHKESGIRTLVKMLCKNSNRIDGSDCLVRHTTVEKSATGGSRNIPKHLNSIRVDHLNLITGKEVLLLDDVTTSHSSIIACQQLLQQYNPQLVVCYALGQTV